MNLHLSIISGFSGWVVDASGYTEFFIIAAGLGVPAILLVFILKWHGQAGVPLGASGNEVK